MSKGVVLYNLSQVSLLWITLLGENKSVLRIKQDIELDRILENQIQKRLYFVKALCIHNIVIF